MKLPNALPAILDEAQEIAEQCLVSLSSRVDQYATWKSYMMAGTEDATRPSMYNKCGPHADRLASYLYSPTDVRFLVEFGRGEEADWKARASFISELLSEEYHGVGADLVFGDAVPWALSYGMAAVKTLWTKEKGLDPWLVMPSHLGVWREDVNGFDRQQAICHVSYVTKADLWQKLEGNPKRDEILEKAGQQATQRTDEEQQTMMHQIIIGGSAAVTGTVAGSRGQVDVFNVAPQAQLSPEVMQGIIKFYELWVVDDDLHDWTTIQFVEPGILVEPTVQKRNLLIPGRQPFQMVQPNPLNGYFWGRSEFSDLWRLQDAITQRIDDIEHITRLRAHPPRAYIGFSGISDETKTVVGSLDGMLVESSPNAKIENLAPEMPSDAYANLDKMTGYFDDIAGFTPLNQGVGDAGVRSGAQTQSLQRAGSARMRDRALLLERQTSDHGDLCLELMARKEDGAIQYKDESGDKSWMLSQMPDNRRITVDSHSSSPAFAMDSTSLAFGLAKAGAVTPDGLLLLTHPPQMATLRKQLKDKQAAEAKLVQEHPELLTKGKKGKK